MQAELVALQPQLVATVAEVEELMARIAKQKKEEVSTNYNHTLAFAAGLQAVALE